MEKIKTLPDNQSNHNKRDTQKVSKHCCKVLCVDQQTEKPKPQKQTQSQIYATT